MISLSADYNQRYKTLLDEINSYGLKKEAIERSKRELCKIVDGTAYLKDLAYKPTGVALGCPFPDNYFRDQLWGISKLIEEYLMKINPEKEPSFAFVPPNWYHITIMNLTHFDRDSSIKSINKEQKRDIQTVVERQRNPISIQFNGMILTSQGRLIVRGFPNNNYFHTLKILLHEKLSLSIDESKLTAHTKLGHVLLYLDKNNLEGFLKEINYYGKQISKKLTFNNVYTPLGRINLVPSNHL
ncbi:MAG: hypothetical protein ACFFCZ_04170 [Promethearchaeota archaeon]